MVVGGENYGQGSSREHAALAPRYLGIQIKLVKSFARIHKANLINFGIIPLTFARAADYDLLAEGEEITISDIRRKIAEGGGELLIIAGDREIVARLEVSARHREILVAGSLLNWATT
jgi:aconitate hydratase